MTECAKGWIRSIVFAVLMPVVLVPPLVYLGCAASQRVEATSQPVRIEQDNAAVIARFAEQVQSLDAALAQVKLDMSSQQQARDVGGNQVGRQIGGDGDSIALWLAIAGLVGVLFAMLFAYPIGRRIRLRKQARATCDLCGSYLTQIRSGAWQCDNCERSMGLGGKI